MNVSGIWTGYCTWDCWNGWIYPEYEPDTVSWTAEKDECIWDMNRILYLGLLKRMSISGIWTRYYIWDFWKGWMHPGYEPNTVPGADCIQDMNRILYLGLLERINVFWIWTGYCTWDCWKGWMYPGYEPDTVNGIGIACPVPLSMLVRGIFTLYNIGNFRCSISSIFDFFSILSFDNF